MKIRLFLVIIVGAVLVSACGTNSHKKVTQGIDYSRRPYRDTYYEFTSPVPTTDTAFVPPPVEQTEPAAEEQLGEDEDFTSENLTSSYQTYGDVVATVATRKFKLGEKASRKEMTALMKAVDNSYSQALRTYRPSGFTYSVSSVGAVNPLSDVEVYCRMSENSANQVGQSACTQFFNSIRTNYLELLKEVQ